MFFGLIALGLGRSLGRVLRGDGDPLDEHVAVVVGGDLGVAVGGGPEAKRREEVLRTAGEPPTI